MKIECRGKWTAALVLACMLSSACSKEPATISLELTAYNHTAQGIGSYSVTVPGGKGGGAGFLDAGAGGGGFTCCVSVPAVWRPGIDVTVKWDGYENGKDKIVTRVVPVPQYGGKKLAQMNVHFLRDGTVKVFVAEGGLAMRGYPLQGKEAELKPGVPIKIRE